ncbi:MAG TPA: arylsulfatase [Myxococcota bacterium]|nr:arylsulfatase [Myxococcota bacterium]
MNRGVGIGRTIAESTPAFPPVPRPPANAPHVVIIVLDDLGFAQLGCFGSDVATPTIDRLAAGGLRFNQFHVTPLCSPTRACLLTGRNHHAVGMGFLTDIPIGFPGYNGRIPRSAGTLPRILREAGYSTFAVGKWHLTPRWEQNASGPFERWPLGLGFERYYGFLAGDTNQWTPELVRDNGFVEPPRSPEQGYHLTEDLADTAIRLIQDQQQAAPGKPFFLFFATGAVHAPHHVAPEWITPYRGRFDDGWEAWRERTFARQRESGIVPASTTLTERPSWVRAWDRLSNEERCVYARMMEVFAGFLTHTDAQIGRVFDFLDQMRVLDNTLVLVLSDNGASAEGGPTGLFNEHSFIQNLSDEVARTAARLDDLGGFRAYNHYPWGWAWAGNAPFRLWKRFTWLGGVRTPLVVHWPRRIQAVGGVRSQFCHAIDLLPTVLDAVGMEAPESIDGVAQQPIDGASLLPCFLDPVAESPRRTQYFEMAGSRAIYHAGWKATTDHVGDQLAIERALVSGSHDFDSDRWSLFHLDEDFSEAQDLADAQPERVRKLVELWWAEAGRNQVLPLEDSFLGRTRAIVRPPGGFRWRVELRPGGGPVSEEALPMLMAGFVLVAEFDLPSGPGEGVIGALGDWSNGWACYLLRGRPVVTFNLFGVAYRIAGSGAIAAGSHRLRFEFSRAPAGGGTGNLAVDNQTVAEGRIPRDLPIRWQIGGAGFLVGHDRGFPVCDDYTPPFAFNGTLRRVLLEAPSFAPRDRAQEIAIALRHE